MTVNYTTNLGLGLPVTGTESGLWGDIVNNQITSLVDTAISGTTSVAVTTVDVTLTATQGAANQARSMVITLTGASTATRNVICPAVSKIYIVRNTTTGGFAHTFKTSAGTGISVPNGREMFLYCDGTNVLDAVDNFTALAVGGNAISLGGALTTASSLTTSGANALTLTTTGSTNVTLPTTGTLATTSQLGATVQVFTSGSGATFAVPAGVTTIKATIVGGGGGGAQGSAGCAGYSGGGGGGGGATVVWLNTSGGGSITYTVGTGGTAGGVAGGTGNSSSLTYSATTYTAPGGAGGNGSSGAGGGLGTGGNLNIRGGAGFSSNAVASYAGWGGAGFFGGNAAGTAGAGSTGAPYGGGGAGGNTTGSSAGGAGAAGVIVLEY